MGRLWVKTPFFWLNVKGGKTYPERRHGGRQMSANRSPSKRPRSLSLRWGMTRRAMKERVMKGAARGEPRFPARRSMEVYFSATAWAWSVDMRPATRRGRIISVGVDGSEVGLGPGPGSTQERP